MGPYGLSHSTPLPPAFTPNLPGVTYDAARQVSTIAGQPVVNDPAALAQWGVTWGDTANGDSSGDGAIR